MFSHNSKKKKTKHIETQNSDLLYCNLDLVFSLIAEFSQCGIFILQL